MTAHRLTALIIALAVALLIGYDVIAYVTWGVDATISRRVLAWSHAEPVIPFSVGVLCGHFFWSRPTGKQDTPT